jgi:hypothetical protein
LERIFYSSKTGLGRIGGGRYAVLYYFSTMSTPRSFAAALLLVDLETSRTAHPASSISGQVEDHSSLICQDGNAGKAFHNIALVHNNWPVYAQR